jgi:hypothetical protein
VAAFAVREEIKARRSRRSKQGGCEGR